jgi:hypothetical protein
LLNQPLVYSGSVLGSPVHTAARISDELADVYAFPFCYFLAISSVYCSSNSATLDRCSSNPLMYSSIAWTRYASCRNVSHIMLSRLTTPSSESRARMRLTVSASSCKLHVATIRGSIRVPRLLKDLGRNILPSFLGLEKEGSYEVYILVDGLHCLRRVTPCKPG